MSRRLRQRREAIESTRTALVDSKAVSYFVLRA